MPIDIPDLQKLAAAISPTLILFSSYSPKKCGGKQGEALFWCRVTNYYGLLKDSDPYLMELLKMAESRGLISGSMWRDAGTFHKNVCNLRKSYAHNQDRNLYYPCRTWQAVQKYLQSVIGSSVFPANDADWQTLNIDLERQKDAFLQSTEKMLTVWHGRSDREDLVDEWLHLFACSLSANGELQDNVIAAMVDFQAFQQNFGRRQNSRLLNAQKNKTCKNAKERLKDLYPKQKPLENVLYNNLTANKNRQRSSAEVLKDTFVSVGFDTEISRLLQKSEV